MINLKPILFVIGILITVLAAGMAIPTILDLIAHNDDWKTFLTSAFFTAFVGISLILSNRGKATDLNIRQAFILTAATWTVLTFFAALPFMFSELDISFTDAFFETMSGLTTTGATVLTNLDHMPPGILFWRSLLAWLGGIGIIVIALSVLPMLKIGGMQLFRTESSDQSDKILPRATQISIAIGSVYICLTLLCATTLWLAGMGQFDAITHAMTTIATSGFSTHDQSIQYYNNATIEYIITIFMILSSLPFVLYVQAINGQPHILWKDTQVRWFLSILALGVSTITLWLYMVVGVDFFNAFRYAAFNITSIISTTGYSSHDYSTWGSFAITLIFIFTYYSF